MQVFNCEVESWSSGTTVAKSRTTGARTLPLFNGLHFTAIASTKFCPSRRYRVTITYSLYFSNDIHHTKMKQTCTSLPLFQVLSTVLKAKDFMATGNTVVVRINIRRCSWTLLFSRLCTCQRNSPKRLPGQMKGMDATVLRVCEAFNLNTAALPVYNCDDQLRSYEIDDDSDDDEPVFGASDANVLFGTTK
jgi:hypothetical protein